MLVPPGRLLPAISCHTQHPRKLVSQATLGNEGDVAGVRFLGATLSTDVDVYGPVLCDPVMKEAAALMNDYRLSEGLCAPAAITPHSDLGFGGIGRLSVARCGSMAPMSATE